MKENSIPKKILLAIGDKTKDLLEVGAIIIFDPNTLLKGYSLYHRDLPNHRVISNGIYSLKRYGYLKEKRTKNEGKLYLTPKGRIEIIRNILKQKKDKKLKWDRKWRAVIFDIPETRRRDRDFLRKELHWIGFKELQKSVWIFPYDFGKELETLLKFWKIEFRGDIRFLTIEKINDKGLRKYFNLK